MNIVFQILYGAFVMFIVLCASLFLALFIAYVLMKLFPGKN